VGGPGSVLVRCAGPQRGGAGRGADARAGALPAGGARRLRRARGGTPPLCWDFAAATGQLKASVQLSKGVGSRVNGRQANTWRVLQCSRGSAPRGEQLAAARHPPPRPRARRLPGPGRAEHRRGQELLGALRRRPGARRRRQRPGRAHRRDQGARAPGTPVWPGSSGGDLSLPVRSCPGCAQSVTGQPSTMMCVKDLDQRCIKGVLL